MTKFTPFHFKKWMLSSLSTVALVSMTAPLAYATDIPVPAPALIPASSSASTTNSFSGPVTTVASVTIPDSAAPAGQAADMPIIEHDLDRINTTNSGLSSWLGGHTASSPGCAKCDEQPISDIRYNTCDSHNNYLESGLAALSQKGGILSQLMQAPIKKSSIIKPVCLRSSMEAKFGSNSKSFKECSANGSSHAAYRPCISRNYFTLINNSFELVSRCMMGQMSPKETEQDQKLDVRAVYALINIESGFHINAASGSGAGGIGQFTSPAIQDVNKNELPGVREGLRNSKDPECIRLADEFLTSNQPMHPNTGMSCERVSLKDGNPVTNMIYTYAYLKGAKKSLDKTIFDNKSYASKFALSRTDLDKVKRALMVWSHNAGPAGTAAPARALLTTLYRNKKVTDANQFIKEMQRYMQVYPSSSNRSSSRRNETSRYLPAITNTLNNIETNIGGGSCVNF